MRRFNIRHITRYLYEGQVQLLAHKMFLRPREGHDVHITSSKLHIHPAHTTLWYRDAHDNAVAQVEFHEATTMLEVDSEINIDQYESSPPYIAPEVRGATFPFQYDADERFDLLPYMQPLFADESEAFDAWVSGFDNPASPTPIFDVLDRMNGTIASRFGYIKREDAGVQRPTQTLTIGTGSCRDLATLFMETCRHLGLASRFVSGYHYDPDVAPEHGATHAWCEIYIPGAGWHGFDPTTEKRVGAEHIAVAVARHPEWIPPISGNYTGNASATLCVEVAVTEQGNQ